MIAILLILLIVLLFAALPTWPYSASASQLPGEIQSPAEAHALSLTDMTDDSDGRLKQLTRR